MVVMEEFAASLQLSSPNGLSDIISSSDSTNIHIPEQIPIMDNHHHLSAMEPASLINSATVDASVRQLLLPEADLAIEAAEADFVSDLPLAVLGDAAAGLFSSPDSSAEILVSSEWSAEQIIGVVAVAIIVPFILASNLLVIVSVLRFKRLQLPTNYFIVSLAAVDIFVALITPFVIVVEVLSSQVNDQLLCLAPNRILMTACGVSVLTLAAIAYDRHTALVSPLKYVSVMTIRKIVTLVTLTWVYSAVIVWAPLPLGWFSAVGEDTDAAGTPHRCSFKLLHDSAHILFLAAIVGPACVVITVCYFRIYTVARHHARAIAAVENSVQQNLRMRFMMKDTKYSKTLALVIGVFLALWTPYLACLMAQVVAEVHVSPWVWNYLTLLAVLNSGLNPWIYAFKNNEFRAAFRKIFKGCFGAGNDSLCSRFQKDSRRSSALSDVNTFTTGSPTTTSSQSRFSRVSRGFLAPAGRLSDVSCVIPEGGTVNHVFNHKDVDDSLSIIHVPSLPLALNGATLIGPRTSDACLEKRVSTLLSSDSKAFITDLLSLYLQHTLIIHSTHVDMESRAEHEARGHCSLRRRSSDNSSHAEHSYHSDNTEQTYHSNDSDYHSDDQAEVIVHSDRRASDDHSDHCYHSDGGDPIEDVDSVTIQVGSLHHHTL
ncbi:beta-2 adrenergic receptor-like [Littorina saxatilis]|uniref:G-protein coupled receptors family 1 profile domain-containing protein n=1 Tax=Littorina saxatilis TaxID=31220 RepID=A0AAN9BD10_9CAEN